MARSSSSSSASRSKSPRSAASTTGDDATRTLVGKETAIQRRQDAKDRSAAPVKKSRRAVQAGAPIANTLGQHDNDRMVSFYSESPDGWRVEVYWEQS